MWISRVHPGGIDIECLGRERFALRISAETLYVRAGILDARELSGDLTAAIIAEPTLSDDQKQTLMRIYVSFRRENEAAAGGHPRGD